MCNFIINTFTNEKIRITVNEENSIFRIPFPLERHTPYNIYNYYKILY